MNDYTNFYLGIIQIYYMPHVDKCINIKKESIKYWTKMSKLFNNIYFIFKNYVYLITNIIENKTLINYFL